jgi:hypothetical protein
MMHHWLSAMILGTLPFLISGIAHAACLPTLGTDDCPRGADPRVQAIEHHYLDAPTRDRAPSRRLRAKRPKNLPRSPSNTS